MAARYITEAATFLSFLLISLDNYMGIPAIQRAGLYIHTPAGIRLGPYSIPTGQYPFQSLMRNALRLTHPDFSASSGLSTLSAASRKEGKLLFILYFLIPLSAAGEERVVERSKDRVSRRNASKFCVRDGSGYRPRA